MWSATTTAIFALLSLIPASAQIAGRVVLAGGTSPPSPVYLTVQCAGTYSWSGYTNKKGEFISFLQKEGLMSAATSIPRPDQEISCVVEASAPGFVTATARLASHTSNALLTLRPLQATACSLVSYTDMKASPAARKLVEKGAIDMRGQKWQPAEQKFRKALDSDPGYATAWTQLGAALYKLGRPAEAHDAFTKALEADKKFLMPYAHLAVLAAGQNNWKEVADVTAAALKLDPVEMPVLFYYNAVACFNLVRLEEAEKSARRAIELDVRHGLPRAEYVLGWVLAQRGDPKGAIDHMNRYLELLPTAIDANRVREHISMVQAGVVIPPEQRGNREEMARAQD